MVRPPGLLQGDELPGVASSIAPPSPVVVSPVAPSGMLPPAKAGAVPNVDVTPSGPALAEGAGPQPESVGSPEEAKSLAEVAIVPSAWNIEPVPSAPTPGFGPTPGHVGLVVVTSVGAGLRPPAKSSVVPRGIPAPPTGASVPTAPMLFNGGVAMVSGVPMPGGLTCARLVLQPNKSTAATITDSVSWPPPPTHDGNRLRWVEALSLNCSVSTEIAAISPIHLVRRNFECTSRRTAREPWSQQHHKSGGPTWSLLGCQCGRNRCCGHLSLFPNAQGLMTPRPGAETWASFDSR
jgi:hypothetical protein